MTKETPRGWGLDRLCQAVQSIGSASPENDWHGTAERSATPTVRRIRIADLTGALASGLDDFKANRTGVIFLCAIYPIVGLVLGLVASGDQVWAVVFPLASGFALVGPLAAVGLSEMSRRRERGDAVRCRDAFGVLRSPSIGAIALLGLLLVGIFLLWLAAAKLIYVATLGPAAPASVAAFAYQVLGTPAGWAMIAIGVGVGFLFAVPVLAIGFVAFPLLLDRNAGISTAVWISVQVVAVNPGVMAAWGAIVVALLVIGSLPALVGLAMVLPVVGHATWHLYRRAVG